MRKRIIIMIIITFCSCNHKKFDYHLKQSLNQGICLNSLIDSIESSHYLNNEFKINFGIIDRGYGILDVITKYGNFLYIKDEKNNKLDTLWVFTNKNKPLDNIVLKEVFNLSNLLVKYCSENSLLNINYSDVFQEHDSDSNILIFTTLKYDSTLAQLQQVDSSFYDYELYIHDNPHYLYTLIYKVKDTIDSKEFLDIKQKHTIRKIKPNWYYYRSYKISDRIKMDYFLNKE